MTQSCDICRGDRYQRRGRGDQGQQGTQDWPEAQGRQCKISPQNYYYVTLILLHVSGIEDLHKVLLKHHLFPSSFLWSLLKPLLSVWSSQGLIVSRSSFVGISRIHKSDQDSDLQCCSFESLESIFHWCYSKKENIRRLSDMSSFDIIIKIFFKRNVSLFDSIAAVKWLEIDNLHILIYLYI